MPQDTMTAFRGGGGREGGEEGREGGRGERKAGREGMLKIISPD